MDERGDKIVLLSSTGPNMLCIDWVCLFVSRSIFRWFFFFVGCVVEYGDVDQAYVWSILISLMEGFVSGYSCVCVCVVSM